MVKYKENLPWSTVVMGASDYIDYINLRSKDSILDLSDRNFTCEVSVDGKVL